MTEIRHCHGHENVKVYEVSGENVADVLRKVTELVESTEDDLLALTGPSLGFDHETMFTAILG